MKIQSSLFSRALVALLLTIGFYVLALAIAGGLLYIPYAELRYTDRLHGRLAIACVLGAGTILFSIWPRREKFQAPGPTLTANDQPLLHEEVANIARETGQEMPEEIYLVPDVNAFVAEHGGFLGMRTRRIMGVGLPLLQALTLPQLRAVLAHEFGHYYEGDTKLGIWVYRVRSAIIRTIAGFKKGSVLRQPFVWYAKLFLRITHAISRQQEFIADQLAAQVAGKEAIVGGLQRISGASRAFMVFWQYEYAPVLRDGFRPPLAVGFAAFLSSQDVIKNMDRSVDEEMSQDKAHPYDTHPSLAERIAALDTLPDTAVAADDTPAISLLANVPNLEEALFSQRLQAGPLKQIAWEDIGTVVLMPAWKKLLSQYHDVLSDVTLRSLPDFLRAPEPLVQRMRELKEQLPDQKVTEQKTTALLGRAVSLVLVGQGWELKMLPGEGVMLSCNDMTLRPFSRLAEIIDSDEAAKAWQQQCLESGIADLELGQSLPNRS